MRDRRGGMPSAEELLRLEVRERTTSLNRPADLTPPIPCQDAAAQALRDQSAIPMQDFDSFRAQFPSLSDSAVAAARRHGGVGRHARGLSRASPAGERGERGARGPPGRRAAAARARVGAALARRVRVGGRLVAPRPSPTCSATTAAATTTTAPSMRRIRCCPDPPRTTRSWTPSGATCSSASRTATRRDAAIGLAGEGAARRGTAGGAARDDDDFEETVDLSAGGETATGDSNSASAGGSQPTEARSKTCRRRGSTTLSTTKAKATTTTRSTASTPPSPARDDSSDEESAPTLRPSPRRRARARPALTSNGDGGAAGGGLLLRSNAARQGPTARGLRSEQSGRSRADGGRQRGRRAGYARPDGGARGALDRLSNQTGADDARNQDDALLDEVGVRRPTPRTARAREAARARATTRSHARRAPLALRSLRVAPGSRCAEPVEPARAPPPISAHERELLQSFLEDLAHDENQRDVGAAARNQLGGGSANQADGGVNPPRSVHPARHPEPTTQRAVRHRPR